MPNTREKEKLIELLNEAGEKLKELCGGLNDNNGNGVRADHLIANGVTVQEWISVKERLPELHTKVLCCGAKGGRFIAETSEWGEGHLYWTKKDGKGCSEVTHWMPLPEPPKGE